MFLNALGGSEGDLRGVDCRKWELRKPLWGRGAKGEFVGGCRPDWGCRL